MTPEQNGTVNTSSWQQLLAKHGPWAFGCAVMGFVIYTFVLMPSASEREAFVKTSVLNAESMRTVAESTRIIKESIGRQEQTLVDLRDEVINQTELRSVAMETMSAFADEMREVNPANGMKLDVIMRKVDEDDTGTKLDIIIRKMEVLEDEAALKLEHEHEGE